MRPLVGDKQLDSGCLADADLFESLDAGTPYAPNNAKLRATKSMLFPADVNELECGRGLVDAKPSAVGKIGRIKSRAKSG